MNAKIICFLILSLAVLAPASFALTLEEELEQKIGLLEDVLTEEGDNLDDLANQFQKVNKEKDELKKQIKQKDAEIARLKNLEDSSNEVKKMELIVESKDTLILEAQKTINDLLAKNNTLQDKVNAVEEKIKQSNAEIAELKMATNSSKKAEDSLLLEAQKTINNLLAKNDTLQEELDIAEDKAAEGSDKVKLLNIISEYEIRNKELVDELVEKDVALTELKEKIFDDFEYDKEKEDLRRQLRLKESEIERLQTTIRKTIERIGKLGPPAKSSK